MKKRDRVAIALIVVFSLPPGFPAHAHQPTARSHITTFEAPGAGSGLYEGTVGSGINFWGTIAGYSADSNGNNHGYIRARNGAFTQINHPLAATGFGQGTSVIGINDDGAISGYYLDAKDVFHGFIRRLDGAFETFDAPGADTGAFDGTLCQGINVWGGVTGTAYNATTGHGFVRSRGGAIVSFDPPGSVLTVPFGINAAGAITGYYVDGRWCVSWFCAHRQRQHHHD
jgi:hypothetical protein